MNDINYAPVCGIYCGGCNLLGNQCAGCGNVAGKPFWTRVVELEICPLYDCCLNQKQLEHCGLCHDFPCEAFISLRDPNMSDKEFEESLISRQQTLRRRAEIGTDAWLKEKAAS